MPDLKGFGLMLAGVAALGALRGTGSCRRFGKPRKRGKLGCKPKPKRKHR